VKVHKLAGIDIGSNSVRLLVTNVIKNEKTVIFKKSSLTRLPIRLGLDAFGKGAISPENQLRLIKGMEAYRRIMEVHGVERYRACATSALRESSNGLQVVEKIYQETGVNIELINGKEEARIIFNTEMLDDWFNKAQNLLYIDVGGGSTELTFFSDGEIKASKSFKIGTIRLLQGLVKKKRWHEMRDWIKEQLHSYEQVLMVGSGGNINRTFKLAEKRKGEVMSYQLLKSIYQNLLDHDQDDRMIRFDLNPDRADVITHALEIYTSAMKWAGADKMLVPKKGLADGIVRFLYREHFS
jgi:exopolyphosphatase/guanosine-5'-triphosphate,3'-diphosphate pyrophosphatase